MKKVLILAMSLLSTSSLFASDGIDLDCKIIKSSKVVAERVITADSRLMEEALEGSINDDRGKFDVSLSATTFSESEDESGIVLNLDVKSAKLTNFTGKTPRYTAKFPINAKRLEVAGYAGEESPHSYYIAGICERID